MSSPGTIANTELPAVDDRLVTPGTRYEIDDGKLVYVPPSDEPHAACHADITVLLVAHVTADYRVAADMLTRTSRTSDVAPDASIYPRARDPKTGGRQLEELAFEVVSTQSLSDAGRKAAKLAGRGVRRCFAVDVERARAFEWSRELVTWSILDTSASIEDPVFAVPLPVAALVAAAKADYAVGPALSAALVAKRDPVIVAENARARAEGEARGRAEGEARGRAEGLIDLLELRSLHPLAHERERILDEKDLGQLKRWYARALTCRLVSEIFDVE
jgi:Uma2 family endonuclease